MRGYVQTAVLEGTEEKHVVRQVRERRNGSWGHVGGTDCEGRIDLTRPSHSVVGYQGRPERTQLYQRSIEVRGRLRSIQIEPASETCPPTPANYEEPAEAD